MKKGFIIFLNILLIFLISSCDKLVKYENEVTYVEFIEVFKEDIRKSIITDNMNFDFIYSMESIEKYHNDENVKINSTIEHDKTVKLARWIDITNDVEEYIYIQEIEDIVTIYNTNKDLTNIESAGTNYNFEYYMKYNVIKAFNYNFIPDDYKCYIDHNDDLNIYTFIYTKDTYTETFQYVISNNLVSKLIIKEIDKDFNDGELKYKKEYHEFKLKDVDLYKDYLKISQS